MDSYVIIVGISFQLWRIPTVLKVMLQVEDTKLQNETTIENICHPKSNDRVFKMKF